MPSIKHRPATSCRRAGGISNAGWLARWLLVLALAFDLLSAPLHQHHHEGAGGPLGFTTVHALLDDAQAHAIGDEHPLTVHATLAIRVDLSRLGRLLPPDNTEVAVALVSLAQLLAAVDEPRPEDWQPDRARPDIRPHISLPPAGRAPPLHA